MSLIGANELKRKMLITVDDQPYTVVDVFFASPTARGAATMVRTKLRQLLTGSVLEKSSSDEPHTLDEPDFDRIYVLGYDKYRQEHYTAYRSQEVKGYLPLRVEGQGDNKTFTVRVQGDDGQMREEKYSLYRDDRGNLKVTPPGETTKKRR